jgi:phosphoglycerate kinase
MAKFRTLDEIDVQGKRVLLRSDLNAPVNDGVVTDATRIEQLAPTIKARSEKGAKVIVMSHFGRPQGPPAPAFSLRAADCPLQDAIGGRDIAFAADCIGDEAKRVVMALQPGQVGSPLPQGKEANLPSFARAAVAALAAARVTDRLPASRPRAAPSSNGWKAAICQASPRSPAAPMTPTGGVA